ncbi:bifunctional DedA family/phosphatase PAP2 family protein [Planosporangium sp. 12N6]|uniref:bifunctional DedA family/phosphatase PAP2 family protein n=1 Tax=Planosporangium spinosum TaxID=3402278 RepID=UPI003CEC7365
MTVTIARYILGLHGWAALAVVFTLPLLESSTFLGFVFPGEIAVLLGGVLAVHHRADLPAVLVAAVAGAVLGDSVGYAVGRRYGRRLLDGPAERFVRRRHLDRAERYLAERGGKAVFLGRFTAALRVLIPGLAGMARMPYGTFALYNVTGGAAWATVMVAIGYAAGANWQRAAHLAGRVGLVMLALFALGFAVTLLGRAVRRRSGRVQATGDRLAATPPAAWVRRRFPAQVAWLRHRLDPATPDGLTLTVTVTIGWLCACLFVGLTDAAVDRTGLASLDPRVQAFVVARRTGWLTLVLGTATWLGSSAVLVPLLLVTTVLLVRHRGTGGWWAARHLWAAYLGAVVLYQTAKYLVARPRPAPADMIGHAGGAAYPSGHTTQAVATWGMLAIVLLAGRSRQGRACLLSAVAAVVLLVGASRIYLGAHWLTDVLGGYALGGAWLALILALYLRGGSRQSPRRRETPPLGPQPPHEAQPPTREPRPPSRRTGAAGPHAGRLIPPGGPGTMGS